MYGLIVSGVAVVFFGGLYALGVTEARRELRLRGQWVEPPQPLPEARVVIVRRAGTASGPAPVVASRS